MRLFTITLFMFILLVAPGFSSSDWPMFKGNVYLTGNNDQVQVKNNNLKWLYQAQEKIYNPVISDGVIYFTGHLKNIYAVDEESGKLLWKRDLKEISKSFYANIRAPGKIKYPLVYGNYLYITDAFVIYAINKKSGHILWARTGMLNEKNPDMALRRATVDNIYSDPVIHDGVIYYGTRRVFVARDVRNGHLLWARKTITTYSGFPFVYDGRVFTQSMDYRTRTLTLLCLEGKTGETVWKREFQQPFKIFSPVIYQEKVIFPHNKGMVILSAEKGEILNSIDYDKYITSDPAFTDSRIFITLNNSQLVSVDPSSGKILETIEKKFQSRPRTVLIENRLYVATTYKRNIGKQVLPYTSLVSLSGNGRERYWAFKSPFPGASGQPVASRGIIFQPAGNYLYAIGADFYPDIVQGGGSTYNPYNQEEKKQPVEKKPVPRKGIPTRKIKVTVKGPSRDLPAQVEVRKWDKGKLIYRKRIRITKPGQVINVPDTDDVELTATSRGHLPRKVIVSRKDEGTTIELDPLKKGKAVTVDNIYFEFGKYYLRKESLNILDSVVTLMKENPGLRFQVNGHTDSIGKSAYNMYLSRKRAQSVVSYLVKQGISPRRLKARGYGETRPRSSNKTSRGRRLNRRTEFMVLQ